MKYKRIASTQGTSSISYVTKPTQYICSNKSYMYLSQKLISFVQIVLLNNRYLIPKQMQRSLHPPPLEVRQTGHLTQRLMEGVYIPLWCYTNQACHSVASLSPRLPPCFWEGENVEEGGRMLHQASEWRRPWAEQVQQGKTPQARGIKCFIHSHCHRRER